MSDDVSQSAFSLEYEEEALPESKPFSQLAVVAAVMAVASTSAVVDPFLAITSVLTVFFGVLSIRACTRPGEEMAGAMLAVGSIFFAVTFAGFGIAREYSRTWTLYSYGEQFVANYLSVVTDGSEDCQQRAHQLTLFPRNRCKPDQTLEQFYEKSSKDYKVDDPGADPQRDDDIEQVMEDTLNISTEGTMADKFEIYRSARLMQTLFELDQQPQVRLVRNVSVEYRGYIAEVNQVYRLTYQEDGTPRSMEVLAKLERVDDSSVSVWRVAELTRQ